MFDFPLLEVRHEVLWKKPSLLIDLGKEILRNRGESMVQRMAESPMYVWIHEYASAASGKPYDRIVRKKESEFRIYAYGDRSTGEEHIALVKNIRNGKNVPLRVHSSCVTAEVFHASNCDCHEQLEAALALIDKQDFGIVIWLHQEGRGNGLAAKIKQLNLMLTEGLDTVSAFEKSGYPADQRDYTVAADILKDLGVRSVKLITNNPEKQKQLSILGIKVTGRIPCEIAPANEVVRKDLKAKKEKLGHILENV